MYYVKFTYQFCALHMHVYTCTCTCMGLLGLSLDICTMTVHISRNDHLDMCTCTLYMYMDVPLSPPPSLPSSVPTATVRQLVPRLSPVPSGLRGTALMSTVPTDTLEGRRRKETWMQVSGVVIKHSSNHYLWSSTCKLYVICCPTHYLDQICGRMGMILGL